MYRRVFVEGPAGQGQLLDVAPGLGQHVRERLLPAPPEALQVSAQAGDEASSAAIDQARRPRRRRRRHAGQRQVRAGAGQVSIGLHFYFTLLQAGSVAEWLACWTRAQKGPGSNRSRDAVR